VKNWYAKNEEAIGGFIVFVALVGVSFGFIAMGILEGDIFTRGLLFLVGSTILALIIGTVVKTTRKAK
jgi:hypothetical protein